MTEADRPRFVGLVEALCASFGVEPTKALLAGYWLALSDLPAAALDGAVGRALREAAYMPRPVQLRRMAGEVPVIDRAILAWRCVMDALAAFGPYESFRFDDPTIHEALETIGGYRRLCELDAEDLEAYEQRRFAQAYEIAWNRADATPGLSPRIIGDFEASNRARGFLDFIPETREIKTGLPPKALPGAPAQPRLGGRKAPQRGQAAGPIDQDGRRAPLGRGASR